MRYLLYHASNDTSIELMTLGRQELVVYAPPLLEPNAAGNLENRVRELTPSLAAIIAQGMRQKGYNQLQLSAASGISPATISKILSSSHGQTRVDTLQSLGRGLEINLDELLNAVLRRIGQEEGEAEVNAMLHDVDDEFLEKMRSNRFDKGFMTRAKEAVVYFSGLSADRGFVIRGGKCVQPNRVIAGYFLDAKGAIKDPDHVMLLYEPLAAEERETAKQLVAEKHGGVVVFHNDFF